MPLPYQQNKKHIYNYIAKHRDEIRIYHRILVAKGRRYKKEAQLYRMILLDYEF
jgi:hypothetical protein